VQDGIGDDYVDHAVGNPRLDVAEGETQSCVGCFGGDLLRSGEHGSIRIHSDYVRMRPPIEERTGDVAGAAAEIHNGDRIGRHDAGDQISEWSRAWFGGSYYARATGREFSRRAVRDRPLRATRAFEGI
jgi:hypothetical protein